MWKKNGDKGHIDKSGRPGEARLRVKIIDCNKVVVIGVSDGGMESMGSDIRRIEVVAV